MDPSPLQPAAIKVFFLFFLFFCACGRGRDVEGPGALTRRVAQALAVGRSVVAGTMSAMFEPVIKRFAGMYWRQVERRLRRYGLLYEDILIDQTPEMKEALRRLPKEEYVARAMRQKRAVDLGVKKLYLPEEMQTNYNARRMYLQPYLTQVINEELEKAAWESGKR